MKTSKELLDLVDRCESDPSTVNRYERKKFRTDLIRYRELLKGEVTSAEKPAETEQDIPHTKWRRIKACLKKVVENAWQIFTKNFWETVFDRIFGPQ